MAISAGLPASAEPSVDSSFSKAPSSIRSAVGSAQVEGTSITSRERRLTGGSRRPIARLSHAELIAHARAVERETTEAIERAKAAMQHRSMTLVRLQVRSDTASCLGIGCQAASSPARSACRLDRDQQDWKGEVMPDSLQCSMARSHSPLAARAVTSDITWPASSWELERHLHQTNVRGFNGGDVQPDLYGGTTSFDRSVLREREPDISWLSVRSTKAYPPSPEVPSAWQPSSPCRSSPQRSPLHSPSSRSRRYSVPASAFEESLAPRSPQEPVRMFTEPLVRAPRTWGAYLPATVSSPSSALARQLSPMGSLAAAALALERTSVAT